MPTVNSTGGTVSKVEVRNAQRCCLLKPVRTVACQDQGTVDQEDEPVKLGPFQRARGAGVPLKYLTSGIVLACST